MTDPANSNAAVHDLLQRASNAYDGAQIARERLDIENAEILTEKARTLVREAAAVDPRKECPAWAERSEMVAGLEKK